MTLVAYSDSEESGDETPPPKPQAVVAKPNTSTRSSFPRIIDPSNPHKIRVSLPETSSPGQEGDGSGEPPTKRAKLGKDGGGFNALLPAPKRTGAVGNVRKGVRTGYSLKTSAEPGFSRGGVSASGLDPKEDHNEVAVGSDHTAKADGITDDKLRTGSEGPPEDMDSIKPQGNATMFKPLSVARRPQKKKPSTMSAAALEAALEQRNLMPPPPVPRVSLFSSEPADSVVPAMTAAHGAYQPLRCNPLGTPKPSRPEAASSEAPYPPSQQASAPSPSESPSLSTIASDLNLSASARRQLFGRSKRDPSAINIINFDTDAEYAANEVARQAGEQAVHNPVRAITAGKHSLRQLVNAVSSQRDALEEQFARGRTNKKEGGARYGW